MSTTAIFVDQVLIGGAFLGMIWLLRSTNGFSLENPGTAVGGILLGAAYILGIFYDRFADTLFENLEKHHRAFFTISLIVDHRDRPGDDPFPEDDYRMTILDRDHASEYEAYLRSRLRLARAMAMLAPGFALAALVPLHPGQTTLQNLLGTIVIVTYALAFLLKQVTDSVSSKSKWRKPFFAWDLKVPRTDKLKNVMSDYKRIVGFRNREGVDVQPNFLWLALLHDSTFKVVFVSTAVATLAAFWLGAEGWTVALPTAGFFAMALFAWTWWRVHETYFVFLENYNKHLSSKRPM